MASPISHIMYAQKYFEKHPMRGNDRDMFILGTSFPDIRMIADNIKRKDTHMYFEKNDLDFSGLDSFQSGWKFHAYCDMRREEILNKYNFYNIDGTSELANVPAKFLEDILLYDKYDNWDKLRMFFDDVKFPKIDLPISKEEFYLWYSIIGKYIERIPNERSIRIFLRKTRRETEKINSIAQAFEKVQANEQIKNILTKVLEEII